MIKLDIWLQAPVFLFPHIRNSVFDVNVAVSPVVPCTDQSGFLKSICTHFFLIGCFINKTEHVEERAKIGEKDIMYLHKLTCIRNSDSLQRQQTANRNLQSSVSQLDHCEKLRSLMVSHSNEKTSDGMRQDGHLYRAEEQSNQQHGQPYTIVKWSSLNNMRKIHKQWAAAAVSSSRHRCI